MITLLIWAAVAAVTVTVSWTVANADPSDPLARWGDDPRDWGA